MQTNDDWWTSEWSGTRSREHLSTVLAHLYPQAIDRLLRSRRLHAGEAYEVASRITQRLISEYERGATYRVPPHVVVRQYCTYLTREYLAEQQYTRSVPLGQPSSEWDDEMRPMMAIDPPDPNVRVDDEVTARVFVNDLLADPAIPEGDLVVLKLRYLGDMAIVDIAAVLRIERNAVDQRLHRALKRLRDLSLGA